MGSLHKIVLISDSHIGPNQNNRNKCSWQLAHDLDYCSYKTTISILTTRLVNKSVYAVLEFPKFFLICNYRNFLSSRDINSTIVSPAVFYSECLFCFSKDSLSRCCQTFGQNEARSFELLRRSKNIFAFSVADEFNINRSWTLSLDRRMTRSMCFQSMTPLDVVSRRTFHAQLLRDDIKHDFVYIFSFMRVFFNSTEEVV